MKNKTMKKTLLLCLFALISCGESKKEFVNDFVFKSCSELIKTYGEPQTAYLKNGAEWILENKQTVTVFYESERLIKPETVRFKNIDVDEDLFYNDLEWDLPTLDVNYASMKTKATNLHGIKEAVYHKPIKVLSITLDNPELFSFGTRK